MSDKNNMYRQVPERIRRKVENASDKDLIGISYPYDRKMNRSEYEEEKRALQIELLKLQKWVKSSGKKIVLVFEGRDAAGKGGTIKRFMEHMNPRGARVVALGIPTEVQKGQWFFQRYIEQLPTDGEIVLFDRSWYNRAIIEPVMKFCTPTQYREFLEQVPVIERTLVESRILLFKFWFDVSRAEQFRRFSSRENDPLKRWKLSPVDKSVLGKWDEITEKKLEMFRRSHTQHAPWTIVRSDGKKRARLNCIKHVLHNLPYQYKDESIASRPDPKIVGTAPEIFKF